MLNAKLQERLDKWRQNTQKVESTEKVRGKVYVPRRDYGDGIEDRQRKDAESWSRELDTNPWCRETRK